MEFTALRRLYLLHILCVVCILTVQSWTKSLQKKDRFVTKEVEFALIQHLGYVNKQFALQRDDTTKELGRQNWISFDRMWRPLRLIDFHHRHLVEAFTTWKGEESAAIERKWQSNANNGVLWRKFFLTLLYKCQCTLFMAQWREIRALLYYSSFF